MNKWELVSESFDDKSIAWHGNKFLIGNGYLGIRGTLEEYTKENMCAINLAGVYDRVGEQWRESVNAPNALYTYIKIDGTTYALPTQRPDEHSQILDFKTAIHTRKTVWNTKKGNIIVECERFASMANHNVIAMKYTLSTDFDSNGTIITGIDGDVWDINGPHFVNLTMTDNVNYNSVIGITGEKSIEVDVEESLTFDFDAVKKVVIKDKMILSEIAFNAKAGQSYSIEKVVTVYTSTDEYDKICVSDLCYTSLKEEHIKAWEKIWYISNVEIDGDDEAMFALNYSIYHLNCIAPRHAKNLSIPARGLSGQVYKGAVFWDTEMFMLDYYLYTEPQIAKSLLKYRIDTLDGAKNKAKQYGFDGAFYAWESQEGGYDACSDYNVVDVFTKRPMRTYFKDKQVHISSAVVYAMMKYLEATGDESVLTEGGVETIIECALFYRSLLLKRADYAQHEIHDVIGPDEYHERVNNNAYTNKMAKFVFEFSLKALDLVKNFDKNYYDKLCNEYDVEKITRLFKDSANNLFVPSPNEQTKIIEQFDGYMKLEDTSVETVKSRLLHPKEYWGGAYGVASHTKVIKQADVVAMLSMFKNEYDIDTMKKNWEYYEPKTEHGSSLSACMYSLLACYTEASDLAYPFFIKSACADLNPGGKEWAGLIYIGGTHPASSGGSWIVAIKGFAGIEVKDDTLVCNPHLPSNWNGMSFKIQFKGKLYEVNITKDSQKITEL